HAGDAVAGAAPQDPGLVLHCVHGGGHREAEAGPGERSARREGSVQLGRGDIGLPGWPGVDVLMQGPDPAHRSVDVNLMMRQDRRVAVDAGRGIHGETFLIARQLAQLRRYLYPGARTCPAWLRWPDSAVQGCTTTEDHTSP